MMRQLMVTAGQNQEANKMVMERMEKNDKTVKDYIQKIDDKMRADQVRSSGEGGEGIGGGKGGGKGGQEEGLMGKAFDMFKMYAGDEEGEGHGKDREGGDDMR